MPPMTTGHSRWRWRSVAMSWRQRHNDIILAGRYCVLPSDVNVCAWRVDFRRCDAWGPKSIYTSDTCDISLRILSATYNSSYPVSSAMFNIEGAGAAGRGGQGGRWAGGRESCMRTFYMRSYRLRSCMSTSYMCTCGFGPCMSTFYLRSYICWGIVCIIHAHIHDTCAWTPIVSTTQKVQDTTTPSIKRVHLISSFIIEILLSKLRTF